MARNKLSIPVERRKAALRSAVLDSRVKIAEHKERIMRAKDELRQLTPKKPKTEEI